MTDIPAPTDSQRAWMLAEQALIRVLGGKARRSIPAHSDDDDIYLMAMIARGQRAEADVAALAEQSERRLRGADNLRRDLELENIRAEASEQMLDDFILTLADVLGFDPNAWDTEGGEELAIDAITRGVKDLQPERRITLLVTAALNFEEYAEHLHDCPIALNQEQPCNCGLEELHIAARALRLVRSGQ